MRYWGEMLPTYAEALPCAVANRVFASWVRGTSLSTRRATIAPHLFAVGAVRSE